MHPQADLQRLPVKLIMFDINRNMAILKEADFEV
jgi:hypothetical protein